MKKHSQLFTFSLSLLLSALTVYLYIQTEA